MQDSAEIQKIIGQVSAMAMMDEAFKARLAADPVAVLAEHGLDINDAMPDTQVEVLDSYEALPNEFDGTLYLVVPSAEELSHEELSSVVGAVASCQSTASTAFCLPSCLSCSSTASTNSCS